MKSVLRIYKTNTQLIPKWNHLKVAKVQILQDIAIPAVTHGQKSEVMRIEGGMMKNFKEHYTNIISIGLRTWVSPVYQAPYAVISSSSSFVTTPRTSFETYVTATCQ